MMMAQIKPLAIYLINKKGEFLMNTNIVDINKYKNKALEYKSFEIFKGIKDRSGRIIKKRTLGQARLFKGINTYHIFIKTLIGTRFFMLPESKNSHKYEYVILTREISQREDRKYYWNSVGEGVVLMGENAGLMRLKWDFFDSDDIYMRLEPTEQTSVGSLA